MSPSATDTPELRLLPPRSEMIRAYQSHDTGYDGLFYTAVKTTGIFCRPSCRPPRLPKPENVEFFGSVVQAIESGYRPCKLCAPQDIEGRPPDWITRLLQIIESDPTKSLKAEDLRAMGISPERTRRWFMENRGMTFAAWLRGRRLAKAHAEIQEGTQLDDVVLGHGYESHSGFRDAFTRAFGTPPGRAASEKCVLVTILESPIGRLLAAATSEGVTELLFIDRRQLEETLRGIQSHHQCPVLPGINAPLELLRQQLEEYFQGARREFTVRLAATGTPFQIRVWNELSRIPFGTTLSYQQLAERIGQPTAMRAVARANGDNRLTIVIPCHRVIGKDGTLTGYGGGLWRKRLLLGLEQTGKLPS
jgi:AraC family transcriptional regulator of adaptative response/methylated-DNA-[protein]-cysteine methyltransferase